MQPSLFPRFLDPLSTIGGVAGAGDISVTLDAQPDITLEADITITLDPPDIDIELEPEIEIEVPE